jgi:hypothetical protein
LLALSLISACARIVAPSGGPEDVEPPVLISVDPEAGPGMPGLRRIVLRFSERLDEPSAEVSLYPALQASISVSGRSITIELANPLGEDVLVAHLPGTLSDAHGNEIGVPVDMAWCGGDSLPSGAIRLALSRQGGGVPADRVLADICTPEGMLVRRTSADTSFAADAGWLEQGTYVITAYEDPDFSFTWEPATEAGEDTTVFVDGSDTLSISMVLAVVDTLGPMLSSATFLDIRHLQVTFSEQVDLEAGRLPYVTLTDSAGSPVQVFGAWKSGARDQRSLVLATGRAGAGSYLLRVAGVSDMVGNPGLPDSLELEGSDSLVADTLRIRSMYPAPGATEAPPSGPYGIGFSDWVDPDSLLARLSLVRISDSTAVPISMTPEDGRSFLFTPEHELFGEEQYRVQLDPGLTGPGGDTLAASSWSFVPAWGTEPGAMEVRVRGGQDLILEITPAGRSGGVLVFRTGGSSTFAAEPIPAGRYTVTAYADLNGDGDWDGASGEPYGAAPGVVLVRPGMVTSGVSIEILP